MLRTFFSFLLIGLSIGSPLSSKIIEAHDLDTLHEHFKSLDSQSLLLWDVDETLMIPSDAILKPCNVDFLDFLIGTYFSNKSKDEAKLLFSQIYHRSAFCLVDLRSVELIASLKSRSIPMIAFTAMRTGSYGKITSMEEWRVNHLRALGIDFSSTFPQHDKLKWAEMFPYMGYPAFKEGVLCSDRMPKGIVLASFLEKINYQPNQIIFIDDNLDFLESVDEEMEEMKIPFIGIHYRAVELLEPFLDEELAHHQFHVLTTEGTWLPDHEARAALQR